MAVTVTRGKTHSRFARLLLDGHNVSGDARQLQAVGLTYSEVDISGWLSTLVEIVPGRAALNFGPFQALYNNRAGATGPVNAGSFTALKGNAVKHALLVIGIGESPTIGAPAFAADVTQLGAPVNVSDNAAVLMDGNFNSPEAGDAGWGQMLAVGQSLDDSEDLGSLDNGAQSTGGYLAFLHLAQPVGAIASNDFEIVIEHSTDDSNWSTLHTFAADGSAVTSEKGAGTGTVNRYVRVGVTKSAGTDIVPWIFFKRL